MNREALRAAVLEALHRVAPEADLARLPSDAEVRASLDLDSFAMLQMLVALHEQLGVDVPEADVGGLVTTNDIVEYLGRRLAAKRPSPSSGPQPTEKLH